ncbi:MAG: rhomboid family intramembrane serine protease [Verrucomicrobiales bacterium]
MLLDASSGQFGETVGRLCSIPTPMTTPEGEEIPLAHIHAHSEKQAMDWSLVLASQDIQTTILREPESKRWRLEIPTHDHSRALEAIRQYRLENRGWEWRRELPGANLEIHVGALFWCIYLAAFYLITTSIYPELRIAGRLDSELVKTGEWWRLFTPVLLHADMAHLAANAVFGTLFLGLAMARFGPGVALLATFLAGAAGNIFGVSIATRPYYGVGASGMMMGALGMLCIHSAGLWRINRKSARYIMSGVASGIFIFVLFGLNPSSDIMAHTGGFLGGLFFGTILAFIPEEKLQFKKLNLLALSLLGFLVIGTWALAMYKG